MEDEKGLRKIMEFMRLFAIVLLGLNVYYYCFGYFRAMGWAPAVVERLLESFTRNTFLFKASWVSKTLAVVFLLLSCLGTRGRKDEKVKGISVAGYAVIGLALLYGADLIRSFALSAGLVTGLYVVLVSVGFLLLLSAFVFPAYLHATLGKPWERRRWLETALLAFAAANLGFWFISAPDLRFGIGFFWCGMALLVAFWLTSQTDRSHIVLGVSLLAAFALSNKVDWLPARGTHRWKIPRAQAGETREIEVPNGQIPKLVVRTLAGKSIETGALGDCMLPSSPYVPTSQLQWRNPGKLRNGFRLLPETPAPVKP